jgi:hypothetical protein
MALIESGETSKDVSWLPKLMTAVLVQACCDLQSSALGSFRQAGKTVCAEDVYAEAREWFLSQDEEVFSLRTVCECIGLSRKKVFERVGPYLCPALFGLRRPYIAGEWRSTMKDCKAPQQKAEAA